MTKGVHETIPLARRQALDKRWREVRQQAEVKERAVVDSAYDSGWADALDAVARHLASQQKGGSKREVYYAVLKKLEAALSPRAAETADAVLDSLLPDAVEEVDPK